MHERENKYLQPPVENDWASRGRLKTLVLMGATAICICFRLALPFLPAVAWALALAVLFAPFHRWLESRIKSPGLAAMISVLVVGVVVAIPAMFVGDRLIREAVKGTGRKR